MKMPACKLKEFEEIIDLFEADLGKELDTAYIDKSDSRRLFLGGMTMSTDNSNELMLRLNIVDKELVVARIHFVNQRAGYGTRLLNILTTYAKERGYEKIVFETVSTEMLRSFAKKYGFRLASNKPRQRNWEKPLI